MEHQKYGTLSINNGKCKQGTGISPNFRGLKSGGATTNVGQSSLKVDINFNITNVKNVGRGENKKMFYYLSSAIPINANLKC